MAFREEIGAMPEARLLYDGGDPKRSIDLKTLLAHPAPGDHVYVCGPKGLIGATLDTAKAAGWPEARRHFELFNGAVALAVDQPVEIVLKRAKKTVMVPAGTSILDALIEADADPIFDCKRGECGICATTVLEGVPDHRDFNLSDNERASNTIMCTCVSRAKTPRLVLDL